MPRYRIKFSKGDQVRFLSHLDLVKAFERAIRRAAIPIAFSEGFNPHPKMNFASALAVGVVSAGEYMDIDLRADPEPAELANRLAQALPPGIGIKTAARIPDRTPSLMAIVNRAVYQITAPLFKPVGADELEKLMQEFLKLKEVVITKRTKKGPRKKNIRSGIMEFSANPAPGGIEFHLVAALSNEGNVRPEEAVAAFLDYSGLPVEGDAMYIKRQALLIEENGQIINPADYLPG